jgi:hypothetical protein
MAKSRYAACMKDRSEAQKFVGVTEAQREGLVLGREKGTNHRAGYKHREESKQKVGLANRAYWADHPEEAITRGAKVRGENHYSWKGGITKLNKSVRQMTENRKWMDAVKARDGKCVRCGSTENLESHHIRSLSEMIDAFGIKSREDARNTAAVWDLLNGETLCVSCHYKEHGRTQTQ